MKLLTYLLYTISCSIAVATAAHCETAHSDQGSHARELVRQGNFEKGLEQLSSVYKFFPLNESLKRSLADGYASYGHTFLKQRHFEQADENFVKAAELYPDDPGFAFFARGLQLSAQKIRHRPLRT